MKIFIMMILFTAQISFAREACLNKQEISGTILKTSITYRIDLCQNDNTTAQYLFRAMVRNKIVFKYKSKPIISAAYTLSAGNAPDLNGDGIQDFSISNGKGKSGDGMDYFLVFNEPPFISLLGDFPYLEQDKNHQDRFFAVVPGSGDNIATRIDYAFEKSNLVQVRRISYKPNNSGQFEVYFEYLSNINHPHAKTENWDESNISKCMSGDEC